MKPKHARAKLVRFHDNDSALAFINRRLPNLNPPVSIRELESKRHKNAAAIKSAMTRLDDMFCFLCKNEPNLLAMLDLCRLKLDGDSKNSFFGQGPRKAFLNSVNGSCVIIIHRFGYSNVENTVSVAILPNNDISLVVNTYVPDMDFFYHTEIGNGEAEPVNYNRFLLEWLEGFTKGGRKGRAEFRDMLFYRIRQILSS